MSVQISKLMPNKHIAGGNLTKLFSYIIFFVILAIVPLLFRSQYILHILIITFIYTIASVSLRTITISGQFPLAHGAFMGIGAYTAAMISKWLGWPAWFTIPTGAIVAMGIGMLTGYPFARLRSMYYAMGSLFFGIAVVEIIYAGGNWTGGYAGITGIHPIFIGSRIPYYYFFLGIGLISLLALYRFEFSRIGIDLKAIAQSHIVASSVGINEGWYRILAVGVGCFFVGLAGAGYAHYNLVLSATSFDMSGTFLLVMYVLVGGIDSFGGAIIGTFVLVLIPQIFRVLQVYAPYLTCGLILIVAYLMPQGLAGIPQIIRTWYLERRKEKKVIDVIGN